MTPLLGFAPDADPTLPGVITACSNLIPFEAGMKGAPVATSAGVATLAAACRGITATSDLSGNRRLIAGTSTKLYELSSTTWTDRSRATSYTLGADDRWSFIQYANSTLAATPSAVLQRSTSGAFADIATAPQAKLIESAQGFAVAFNTQDATYGSSPDRWWCSALYDETNWTPAISTQCTTGRLVGGSGPLTAARRFGDNLVAYKSGTMFVGSYVGAPEVWRWAQVSTDVGCVGQDAVVDTVIGHIFVGKDNVYLYDGTTPRPLANGTVRRWLFADMSSTYQYKVQCLWDRTNHLVWIFYPSSDGTLDRTAVYHVLTQRWGLANQAIQAVVNYTSPTITFDGGSSSITTYDAGPTVPFDSPFWIAGGVSPAVVSSSVLSTLSGACASASFTTGDFGDDEGYRTCTNLRVRYTAKPTTSIAVGFTKDAEGDTLAINASQAQADGRHNLRQTARWHRFAVTTTGDFEVTAVRPEFKEGGRR